MFSKKTALSVSIVAINVSLLTGASSLFAAHVFAQSVSIPSERELSEERELIEEVTVTGYRRSLLNAIDTKRFSDTVSEVLSADDLGSLPDVSMADALTRLPGISAVRTGGEAGEINIRGMSGGFVMSTLNGREQVSPSGKRSIEFEQYPSELISAAQVYKSPKASLIEGGVAGTVELKTASPLSLSGDNNHQLQVNARGMFNDRASDVPDAEEFGHRFSFSYQGVFLDDTLGFAAGYARLYQPSVTEQFVGLAYNGEVDLDNDGQGETPVSEGFELQHKGGEEARDGYMATIEWAPTDNFTVKVDGFRSVFDVESFARGFRVKFLEQSQVFNPRLNDLGNITGGTFNRQGENNFLVQTTNDDDADYNELTSLGLNAEWNVGQWTFSADVSNSRADSEFKNGVSWALLFEDPNADIPIAASDASVAYQLNNLNLPSVGFNQDYTNLQQMMLTKYGTYPYENTDEVEALKFDVDYEFDDDRILTSMEFGVRRSQRQYTNDRSMYEYGSEFGGDPIRRPLPLTDALTDDVNFSNEFDYLPSYLAIDVDAALNLWLPSGEGRPVKDWNNDWTFFQSGSVDEDVLAAYVMANFDFESVGIPISGNIGVRRVETEQKARGLQDVGGDPALGARAIADGYGAVRDQYAYVTAGIDYVDYLPSLNLNYRITEQDQVRFALAKVMARPPIERLLNNASINFGDDGQVFIDSSNNPALEPFYANQLDLSYERYFNEGNGAFVAALFYKDIDSFVQTSTVNDFNYAAVGFDLPRYVPGTEPGNPGNAIPIVVEDVARYTAAFNNAEGGYVRGVELAYTQTFTQLPGIWSGLGFSGSYSYTESEVTQLGSAELFGLEDVTIPLEGLSKNVVSATLFYDYENFSTRVNVRYRDDFVSEQVAVESQTVFFSGETVVDYQASYALDEGLTLLFQVNNLTDEPTRSYFLDESQTGTIQFFGRQVFLGVSYRL
ncbi:TonB-dependent receptor [Marinibactrum halimedae]|uniref:TonB-dependent receptor n=1 Tax=Marinibactrum halimedae TaxID=1444977 RepID=UPI001E4DDD9E|nr:TonB-dependent receptor [Marinibactrum halimedae]MCD9457927.1 TonB-dependent receptor [Marinibactrum halimedae]